MCPKQIESLLEDVAYLQWNENSTLNFADPVKECSLSVTSLDKSVEYWKDFLQMDLLSKGDDEALLSYGKHSQCNLHLKKISGESLDHAQAYGRMAFSVPENMVSHGLVQLTRTIQLLMCQNTSFLLCTILILNSKIEIHWIKLVPWNYYTLNM